MARLSVRGLGHTLHDYLTHKVAVGVTYLLLMPTFAVVYAYLIPEDFLHSTITHEPDFQELERAIEMTLGGALVKEITKRHTGRTFAELAASLERRERCRQKRSRVDRRRCAESIVDPPRNKFVEDQTLVEQVLLWVRDGQAAGQSRNGDDAGSAWQTRPAQRRVRLDQIRVSQLVLQGDTISFDVEFGPDQYVWLDPDNKHAFDEGFLPRSTILPARCLGQLARVDATILAPDRPWSRTESRPVVAVSCQSIDSGRERHGTMGFDYPEWSPFFHAQSVPTFAELFRHDARVFEKPEEPSPAFSTVEEIMADLDRVVSALPDDGKRGERARVDAVEGLVSVAPAVPTTVSLRIDANEHLSSLLKAHGDAQANRGDGVPGRFLRMLYFSAVTITTTGYGDILPITNRARLLVAIESTLGIVLIGLFINALFAARRRDPVGTDSDASPARARPRWRPPVPPGEGRRSRRRRLR